MKKYKCSVCGYLYDPAKGDTDRGVRAGTSFEGVPKDWTCPRCNAQRDKFHSIGDNVLSHTLLKNFYLAEDIAYYFVAIILFLAVGVILGITVTHFLKGLTIINVLNVVNDILLVVIVLELFSTVLIYLTERRISLNPFILIGLISSIRRILMVTAMMSANPAMTEDQFHHSIIELVVSAGIVLALIVSYWFLSRVAAVSVPERCIGCIGYEKREDEA